MIESCRAATEESDRLAQLRGLVVLDTPPEPVFDSIAKLASEVCGAPIALLSLVDEERQWFKANVGLPGVNETPRDVAFCNHAIRSDALFEVPDATRDARFADNPLVAGAPDIRFYAGAPLVVPGGARMGTLCVIDRVAKQLDDHQAGMLRSLAQIATQALTMRRDLIERSLSVRSEHELARARNEAFLDRTNRVAGVGGWEVDLVTGRITWSDEVRRLHGVGPDYEPVLAAALDFYPPEARSIIERAVDAGMHGGDPWDLEVPFVATTGRRLWVRTVGEVEFSQGRPVRLVGAIQDITQRKQLEQRVADSERFLRQITDNLPVRIAYTDADLRYRFVNQAHCTRFGVPREQIIGRTRSELTRGATDQIVQPCVAQALAGRVQRFEYEETVGGEIRRIETQLIPDRDDDGAVRGFFSTGVDITERAATERALRELTEILDNTTDFVVQANRVGRITYLNPAARRVLGLPDGEPVRACKYSDYLDAEAGHHFIAKVLPIVTADGVWVGESVLRLPGHETVPVSEMVLAHRDARGRIERYSAVLRDITQEVEAKQEILRQSATLTSVTEAIPASVSVVDRDGRYRFANSAFERWCNLPRALVLGRRVADVLGQEELDRRWPWVRKAFDGEAVSFEQTYADRRDHKHLQINYIPLKLGDGGIDGFVVVANDITPHKEEQARLLQLAQRDPLTGLLNRAGFEEALETSLQGDSASTLALLYIDLDHFKPVNDCHGHAVGDRVLTMFAQRLQGTVRPTDVVARLGGDEFAVVLSGMRSETDVRRVAAKVVDVAGTPFPIDGLSVVIGASVGIAMAVATPGGWQQLLARADAMLYRAKEEGRGRQAGASDWDRFDDAHLALAGAGAGVARAE